MPDTASPFIWCELMTPDADAAQAFYGAVFGWTAQDSGLNDRGYRVLSQDGVGFGGLLATPEAARAGGARPAWFGYIGVAEVDATVAKALAAGASVHRAAEDIPGVGRFALLADPHGAVFVVMKGASDQPMPASGAVGWRELTGGPVDEAFAFYSGLFGWTKAEAYDMGPMGPYQLFVTAGGQMGGMMAAPPAIEHPFWLYYFNVPDVDVTVARIEAEGGRILAAAQEVPTGQWVVRAMDPQGAAFALVGDRG